MATFAEFETNIRKERQLEGIAAAKAKGVIAELVGTSVASVYDVMSKIKKQ